MKMKGWLTLGTIGVLTLACVAMPPRGVTLNAVQSSAETSDPTASSSVVITQADDTSTAETLVGEATDPFAQSSVNSKAGTSDTLAEAAATYSSTVQGLPHNEQTSRALVIRSSEVDPKDQSSIEEDLAVMSHILDKALDEKLGNQSHGRKAMGIDVWFASNSNPFRSLYLEGYGAVFMFKVGFPLLPPPKKETPKEKRETSSTWEEARQELYGNPGASKAISAQVEDYDEEKVTALKDCLFDALQNASNIHDLKPDDSITLCIFGTAGGAGKASSLVKRGGMSGSGSRNHLLVFDGGSNSQARGSIMTIRVRKSEVDALAKGQMDSAEFRKKAKVTVYLGGAEGGAGVFSFGNGFGSGTGNYQFWTR